jgi:hypothetical protein
LIRFDVEDVLHARGIFVLPISEGLPLELEKLDGLGHHCCVIIADDAPHLTLGDHELSVLSDVPFLVTRAEGETVSPQQ